MQIDVGHQLVAVRMVECTELALGTYRREHGDLVVPGERAIDIRVALGTLSGQADVLPQTVTGPDGPPGLAVGHALDQQQPIEVQQGIGQQGLSLQAVEVGNQSENSFVVAELALRDARKRFRDCLLQGG